MNRIVRVVGVLLLAFPLASATHPALPERVEVGRPGEVTRPGSTTWSPAQIPVLSGTLHFTDGDTLRLAAGTWVEARPGSRIVLGRGATVLAEGTPSLPVVLTCPGTAVPGCWGGLVIRGSAPINHGTATSPDGGCLENAADGYGGCDAADGSGRMRYLRVHGAGVVLQGVGSGTVVEGLQVDRAAGHGLEIVGGAVDVARLLLTGNGDHGLAWFGGWRGRGQSIAIVQDPSRSAGGLLGSAAPGPPATSSSEGPTLHNLTISVTGPGHAAEHAAALRFSDGAGGTLGHLLLLQPWWGLDLDGAATCAAFDTGILDISHVLIAAPWWPGAPDLDECGDVDPRNSEAVRFLDPSRDVRIVLEPSEVAALLRAAPGEPLEDLRPGPGSLLERVRPPPPGPDPLFAPADWYGALGPSTAGTLPFYGIWGVPPTFVREEPARALRSGETWVVDLNRRSGTALTVDRIREEGPQGGARSWHSRIRPPARSVLGGDAARLEVVAVSTSEPGEFEAGRTRVWLELRIVNRFSAVDFVTSTFPEPPAGVDDLLLFPLETTITYPVNDGVVEVIAGERVTPSPDWDGSPHDFFNAGDCAMGGDDCFPWEPVHAPLLAGATSEVRRVGFDVDDQVTNFRARIVLVADLRDGL